MNIFSFCLYGSKPKYVLGMFENIKLISTHFPDWAVFVYYSDIEQSVLEQLGASPCVRLIPSSYSGHESMLDRFCGIDEPNVNVMFVRDADSRIHERDRWTINQFLSSPKKFHIVRDHVYHVTPIMGGLWGIKKGCVQNMREMIESYRTHKNNRDRQGFDQCFLRDVLYPAVYKDALIHGRVQLTVHETIIPIPMDTPHEFCGQAIEYKNGEPYHNCEDCLITRIL